MEGIIYRYNSPNGKIYVGQTLGIERKRIDKHKFEALTKKCETPFGNAIRKYGWETIRATYTVVERVKAETKNELKEKLTERENYWIEKYGSYVPDGYNVKLTNQMRLGGYRDKTEMYKKISKSLKGKYLNSTSNSKPIIEIKTQVKFPSISEASRKTGISVQVICRILKGKQLQSNGKIFCYLDENGNADEKNLRSSKRKQLPVYCPELDKTFVSSYEAAKYIGKPDGKSNIRLAAEKGKKRYGYTWIYK